ncbi:MAG: class I SAM-dependent methyltransferase [Nitrosopumilaceae archaeon]|uniref:Class I SAM-dependent methyltransferase n=2 Tax=Candidatus Nitrosomaritimum aestuariumsis TaxID=3342354 RepID=A0AC60VX82_9ARCH|nr:class I SAM-dependent methyltransferase [Nitrosopumilaceae archaeon]MBA4460604.1 class I SAM-dependent methyltransferase [Nitrosopumilaceae archaeon]MBA4460981.1 class I SAM-dependent methyltransferase [Nitrosopumilaceae archaeon]MBA4462943.1 class I SAM-dependent methyltransferase [Nitrosopumilaceae archaeon]
MEKKVKHCVDKVRKTFDEWAQNGRAELMEKEHGTNVSKFLEKISFEKSFSFLDVGCGNGWVVRKISSNPKCTKSIGIDKSKKMISQAKKNKTKSIEQYIHTDIESWKYRGKFDFVFSMESLYYAHSIDVALEKIYKLLKPGGEFFCGTDFYTDNKATAHWAKMMKLKMHLHSKKEWKKLFENAGFETKTRQIKDKNHRKKWKQDFGTLFIIGKKPKKESSN